MGGDGFGSVLASSVVPAFKRGAVNLGKCVLTTKAHMARDTIGGANTGMLLKRRFVATGSNILGDVVGALAPNSLKKRKSTACQQKPTKRRRKNLAGVSSWQHYEIRM